MLNRWNSLAIVAVLQIVSCQAYGVSPNTTSKRCLDIQFHKGNCTLATTRWSFSHTLGKCIPFPGCPNDIGNSFPNPESCDSECIFAGCFLEPKFGLCDGAVNNWFYNPITGLCAQFPTTTCGLNANRFPSEKLCYESCYQAGCTLYPDFGDCKSVLPTNISLEQRWFMNVSSGLCEPFVYASCGAKVNGNSNNFRTQEDCHNICYCNERHVLKAVCKVLPPYTPQTTTYSSGETKFFTEVPTEPPPTPPPYVHEDLLPLPDEWLPVTTSTSTLPITTTPMPLPDDFVPITSTAETTLTTSLVNTTVTTLKPVTDPIGKMMEYHELLYNPTTPQPQEESSAAQQATVALRSDSQQRSPPAKPSVTSVGTLRIVDVLLLTVAVVILCCCG